MPAIRRFARRVARRFQPDKIILFGSHAYGSPQADSDVDLLVVMPCRSRIDQAVRIRWELPAPFPMDLIVRTPRQLASQLKDGDAFLTEVVSRGKLLHEKSDQALGAQGRGRLPTRQTKRSRGSVS
jgi:predicted nucleotidyltransferase